MHLYERKKRGFHGVFRALVSFAVVVLVFLFILSRTGGMAQTRGEQIVRQAVTRAAVTCYTLEGSYPEDLQYLIDNYGLVVNTDKYMIIYEPSGSNLMPVIRVSPKTSR